MFQNLTNEFEGPSAICGYFACAHAVLLDDYLSEKEGNLDTTNIQEMCDIITDIDKVIPHLRRVFTEIQDARAQSVGSASTHARRSALRELVANFEIGDFLSRHAASGHTHFLRMNQWPARDAATPALRSRLAAEERFGGRVAGGGTVVYAESDSVYFLHSFHPENVFRSPEEWALIHGGGGGGGGGSAGGGGAAVRRSRVFVLDLNGHFVTAVACRLCASCGAGAGVEESAGPALLVFNTTDSDCLAAPAVAYAFDAAFPP